ncbi:MAG: hypothetical protein ACRDT6_03270 [Micromonosporaceae bacterium]
MQWYAWLLPLVAVLSVTIGFCGPSMLRLTAGGSDDPRRAPDDPCALIATRTMALVVPSPKVERSEADNSLTYTRYGYCTVATDDDAATSTARASLRVTIERHGALRRANPAAKARGDFAGSKQRELDGSEARVVDLPGLGDSGYAEIRDNDRPDKKKSDVTVNVLVGGDTISVNYRSSPATDQLALAAAVAVARDLLKGLRR